MMSQEMSKGNTIVDPVYQHPFEMFRGVFFNNRELMINHAKRKDADMQEEGTKSKYDLKFEPFFFNTQPKEFNRIYFKDFFHDDFQISPQAIAKHFMCLFQGALMYVLDQRFMLNKSRTMSEEEDPNEFKTIELFNISSVFITKRGLDKESLEELLVQVESKSKNEVQLSENNFNADRALIVNVYLVFQMLSAAFITRDIKEDDARAAKIKDYKDKNNILINYVRELSKMGSEAAEKKFQDLIVTMKLNCDNICVTILNLRLRKRTKGLFYFFQVVYNFIKNFNLTYLHTEKEKGELLGPNMQQIITSSMKTAEDALNGLFLITKRLDSSNIIKQCDDPGMEGTVMELLVDSKEELRAVNVIVNEELHGMSDFESKAKELNQRKLASAKSMIDSLFEKYKTTIYHSKMQNESYVVTFKMIDHYDHFLDLCVIKLKHDQLRCTIHFCKQNYEPIVIPDKLTRSQVSRLFTKKVCKIGGFVINPLSGQISFTYSTFNRVSKYSSGELDTFINRVIKSIFTSAFHIINCYFLSLATKIGLITVPIYKHLESQWKNTEKKRKITLIPENFIQRMNNALELLENCTVPYSEFKKTEIYQKGFSTEDITDIEANMDISQCWIQGASDQSQLEKVRVIEINQKQMRRISGGGFADIYQVEAKIDFGGSQPIQSAQYALKKCKETIDPIKTQQQMMQQQQQQQQPQAISGMEIEQQNQGAARKAGQIPGQEIKYQTMEKVYKEAQIIDQIRPRSKYIARYYFDETKKDHLFMDLYYYTLSSYLHFYSQIMSLQTRLNMILQITQGVKQLQQLGIFHLDLKPPNILLNEHFDVKICDFGESFSRELHKEVDKLKKTGRTLPYSPIESLNENSFSEASDVYSIGAIISEVVFEKRLIEFKRHNQGKLMIKLVQRNYRLVYSDLVTKEFGIKQMMKILKTLMLKCVHPEPNCRPHIDYLIGIVRLFIKVLQDLYS